MSRQCGLEGAVVLYHLLTLVWSSNPDTEHARTRVVDGITHEESPEEVVRSIEAILSKSRQKRRHRKSHGKISFGDLARVIADQWKIINPKLKEIFNHYAEIDMVRYRRELKTWKEKKERESEISALAKHSNFVNQMSNSFNSSASLSLDDLPDDGNASASTSSMHDSFNSSHSSLGGYGSAERRKMKGDSMNIMIQRQQQLLQQQMLHQQQNIPSTNLSQQEMMGNIPGSNAFHQSFSNLPNFGDFQAMSRPAQTMQQLMAQQAMQIEQMRQLQMQQYQIQQQLEFHRNQQLSNSTPGMENTSMTMGSMVQSSTFSESGHPSRNITQPHGNRPIPSNTNTSLDHSIHLHEAVQGQVPCVSDYSSSTGFGGMNSFSAMSQSADMLNSSLQGGDLMQQQQQHLSNMMRQQSNSFGGQSHMMMGGRPPMNSSSSGGGGGGGAGGFSFSSGGNNPNMTGSSGAARPTPSDYQNEGDHEHDLRGMDTEDM